MASIETVDTAAIRHLIERFYGKVRQDPELGPIFDAAVDDWDAHVGILQAFWTRVMLGQGQYKGDPLSVHRQLPLKPELFAIWLGLWRATTAELFDQEIAAQFDARAERIADSLIAGLFFKPEAAKATR
ncbi:group III truncated hemoglobin [Phreatobacter stygius]|uniref:Group III truncated hemoglobin n=1 Tax=Phreatobacter stygius TaxID=1940610 RepID=A0A4D7BA71_9HYPH|nr:group III truncated hemoglobin [Phreatobacter stygius]QCI67510.1 group III truncated hemoglobin [Phreatobacter stygius]